MTAAAEPKTQCFYKKSAKFDWVLNFSIIFQSFMFFKTEFLHSTNWKLNYNSKHFSKFLEFSKYFSYFNVDKLFKQWFVFHLMSFNSNDKTANLLRSHLLATLASFQSLLLFFFRFLFPRLIDYATTKSWLTTTLFFSNATTSQKSSTCITTIRNQMQCRINRNSPSIQL